MAKHCTNLGDFRSLVTAVACCYQPQVRERHEMVVLDVPKSVGLQSVSVLKQQLWARENAGTGVPANRNAQHRTTVEAEVGVSLPAAPRRCRLPGFSSARGLDVVVSSLTSHVLQLLPHPTGVTGAGVLSSPPEACSQRHTLAHGRRWPPVELQPPPCSLASCERRCSNRI